MQNSTDTTAKRRRRWPWLLLLAVAALALWLNGPGLRWLAPGIASRMLSDSGMRVEFALDGNLLGGMSVRDLRVTSDGTLTRLSIDRETPDYRLRDLARGQLRGLRVEGVFVDVSLDAEKTEQVSSPDRKPDKAPLAERVVGTLESLRGRVVPMDIELRDIAARIAGNDGPVLEIAPSSLRHTAGEETFHLQLGAMRDAAGNAWPAQESLVTWSRESLSVDRLDPWPDVSVRGLSLALARENALAAEAELRLGDAAFFLTASPGLESLAMDLREGGLESAELAEIVGIDLPASATLTSLSLTLDKPLPDPARATGAVRILLEDTRYGDWRVPELSVDFVLDESLATLAAAGRALGTEFSVNARTPLIRGEKEIQWDATEGTFNINDVAALASGLDGQLDALALHGPVPPSAVDGSFRVGWRDSQPVSATADLTIEPAEPDEWSALALNASWQAGGPLRAGLRTDGAEMSGVLENDIYQINASFAEFRSERIEGWLAPFGIDPGGSHLVSATLNGEGDLSENIHRGRLALENHQLARDGSPVVSASASINYDWPSSVVAESLEIRCEEQTVRAAASFEGGWLTVEELHWTEGGRDLLRGTAKLPVPEDPGAWRETLAEDTRPLAADLTTEVLPLSLLNPWLPDAEMDAGSTGKAKLRISGSYADPEIDASLELRDVRRAGESKVPSADLDLKLAARDGHVKADGSLTTPGYPAVTLTSAMPFRPAQWAREPATALEEPLEARAELPRLDLAKLAGFVPGVRKLGGSASGRIVVTGTLGTPAIDGRLDLADVGFEAASDKIPPVSAAGASIAFTPERVSLSDLRATIAGGTLRGGGSLTLVAGKPGVFDFQITGRSLPLLRDDSMIVRADANLRLAGEHPRPSLTGSVAVVNSLFYRDIELLPLGVPFTTPSAAKPPGIDPPANPAAGLPAPLRDWPIDVRVTTGNPFLIRGNLARGEITADLRLRGTMGNPLPDGQIRISDLTAELPFSSLEVNRGALRFTPETGFDPILDIRATSNPRPYSVNGYVYGRASDPQLVLTSSPPLPENEIMTLLATGTTTSGLENPQNASSRALQLLAEETRRGRNFIGRELRPLLAPLDRVDFTLAEDDPYSSDSFSTATLSLTDRWFLSAGMSDDGDTRVLAIWRLVFH
ncbi:MAG TPA: translocation/assembly module TamB domain-containing protein [Luteolibacter sp.]|nr:translocation/assembly module TamB domain-containing protein [Luteolibacter sp.]